MERKLICTINSPNTLSYKDMTTDDQTEFDQILDYAYHLEHSGEYSMMYSLNKSRFHKSDVDILSKGEYS
jgi:hypothetical protein